MHPRVPQPLSAVSPILPPLTWIQPLYRLVFLTPSYIGVMGWQGDNVQDSQDRLWTPARDFGPRGSEWAPDSASRR